MCPLASEGESGEKGQEGEEGEEGEVVWVSRLWKGLLPGASITRTLARNQRRNSSWSKTHTLISTNELL